LALTENTPRDQTTCLNLLFYLFVSLQATQVDDIAGNTEQATDNIVDGNEQIRKVSYG